MTARDHNNLLGIFFLIQGGLLTFVGLIMALVYGGIGLAVEPVTNAVGHGAQPPSPGRRCERIRLSLITLTLTLHPDALRAEVSDGSGILPVQRSAGREDECGRGLAIIDALADHWTPGRAPRGGTWVRPCMSGGNGLFDGGR